MNVPISLCCEMAGLLVPVCYQSSSSAGLQRTTDPFSSPRERLLSFLFETLTAVLFPAFLRAFWSFCSLLSFFVFSSLLSFSFFILCFCKFLHLCIHREDTISPLSRLQTNPGRKKTNTSPAM